MQLRTQYSRSAALKGYQTAIECGIDVSDKEKTVLNIKTLDVRRVCPWLYMTGAQ